MLTTYAVVFISLVMLSSMRRLMVAYRERTEDEAVRAVRWATIALLVSLAFAFAQGSFIYRERLPALGGDDALWAGLRAAKDLCAPPVAVGIAMIYLSRQLLNAVRKARR